MIHIVVPSTTTLVNRDDGLTKYTAFNIHVNGWLHASIRYSMLHKFAETIRLKFGGKFSLPTFPPKRMSFGMLEGGALDERRHGIAKYLQSLVQQTEVVHSAIVERTFLEFQLESYRPSSSSVNLEIYYGDGERMSVRCGVLLNTRDVLKVIADKMGYDFDLLYEYFGVFVVRDRKEEATLWDPFPVRLLRNFESPYVSLQLANQRSSAGRGCVYRLQLRRLVWDAKAEERLLHVHPLRDILFKQALAEFRCGLFVPSTAEAAELMEAAASQGHADRFLRLCSQQAEYGYEDLGEADCDMPSRKIRVRVKVGKRQMLLCHHNGDSEFIFRATRVRIWRISQPPSVLDPLVFQFEYLIGKDSFEWITLHTDQAIMLSLLLQSIGADILHEHHEAAKESARQALSTAEDVISPLKMGEKSNTGGGWTSSTLSSSSSISSTDLPTFSPVTVLPTSLAGGETANSTFRMDITDDDL